MNQLTRFAKLIASLGMVILTGCGGDGGDTPVSPDAQARVSALTPAPPASVVPPGVSGLVLSASNGLPIVGASVTAGGVTATTDAAGRYALSGVAPAARLLVNVSGAANFADGLSVTSLSTGGSTSVVTKLIPLGTTATLSNAAGGLVSVPGSVASVTFPPEAFAAGVSNVSVEVTPVNQALDATVMPGDYLAGTSEIESFGALIVTLRDATTRATVNLASGKTATIRIAATSRTGAAAFPATIPLFFLDVATGIWLQEGTATLGGVAPSQYYEGAVSHFSVWNADRVIDTVRVTGCVKDTVGAAYSGVTVRSDGINYSGSSTAISGADGSYSVAMRRSSLATISGSLGIGNVSNTLTANPGAATGTFALTTCLVLPRTSTGATIKLTWGTSPSDIDSYLITPSGTTIYYGGPGSLTGAPFAALDVDDTTSFGPEVVTISRLMVGTYIYGVDNFSRTFTPGITASPTRIELNVAGAQRIFTPPAGETSSTGFLRVFSMTVDARCNVSVTPINTWEAAIPLAPIAGAPTYCTP